MPGMNKNAVKVGSVDLTALTTPQSIDLNKDVPISALELRVVADVTITGAAPGTLLTETPHNILEYVRMEHDGDPWWDNIPGRLLAIGQRFWSARPPRFQTFADGTAQANTILTNYYTMPFMLPFLANPWETRGFFPPVAKTFKIWLKRIQTVDYSVFFSGGTNVLTLNSLTVEVWQHYATGPISKRPALMPRFTTFDSPAISASADNYKAEITTLPEQRLGFLLIGSLRDDVGVNDIMNKITLRDSKTKYYDTIEPAIFQQMQERFYPGLDASAGNTEAGTHQSYPVGYYGFNFLTDEISNVFGKGKLLQAVDARRERDWRFIMDVTHTSGTELIRGLQINLEHIPGWTGL